MLGGLLLIVGVEGLGEIVGRNVSRFGEEPLEVLKPLMVSLHLRVDLDAVAGRENDRFAHRRIPQHVLVGLCPLVVSERQSLEQVHGRAPV
jgi:hypothetical protein